MSTNLHLAAGAACRGLKLPRPLLVAGCLLAWLPAHTAPLRLCHRPAPNSVPLAAGAPTCRYFELSITHRGASAKCHITGSYAASLAAILRAQVGP